MKLYMFYLSALFCNCCLAQTDTLNYYYTKDGLETIKDSAYAFVRFYKQNNVWHGKDYYVKTAMLKSEGDYAGNNVKTPLGTFNNYNEEGKLDFIATYNNGQLVEKTFYYKNGSKKAWVSIDQNGVKQQKGWDENGTEIKNYIAMKEARFKGGLEGWNKYLMKNTNGSIALDVGAPAGEYRVEVLFKISREGFIIAAEATLIPEKCKACANEAVRVIKQSGKWEPAIFQNEIVEYIAKQPFRFVVEEKKKKGRNE